MKNGGSVAASARCMGNELAIWFEDGVAAAPPCFCHYRTS